LSLDLGRREAKPRQASRARPQDRRRLERIERRREPAPNRARARGGELLRNDRRGQPGKAVGPPPQRRPPGLGDKRAEPRLGSAQRIERRVEVGFTANMRQHG